MRRPPSDWCCNYAEGGGYIDGGEMRDGAKLGEGGRACKVWE